MSVPQTLQNAQFAFPVTARNIAPEGQMGVQITYNLTTFDFAQTFSYQLNSPSGFPLSQIATLVIDNTQNPGAISVTHGITNSTVNVPAGQEYIIPTFSNSGAYVLSIMQLTAPTQTVQTVITFLNYVRQADFGTAQQVTQGSSAIGSSTVNLISNYASDTNFNAAINFNASGPGTYTANLPSFNKQGYAITMFTVAMVNYTATLPVITGFGNGVILYGKWVVPPTTSASTLIVAQVGGLSIIIPANSFGVISVTIPGGGGSIGQGVFEINAYGITLPFGG